METYGLIRILRALAHETRFDIAREIARRGEVPCAELVVRFDISRPALSHHIRILRESGLVRIRRDGRFLHYEIDVVSVEQEAPGVIALLSERT